jgi:hypothetical protein
MGLAEILHAILDIAAGPGLQKDLHAAIDALAAKHGGAARVATDVDNAVVQADEFKL